VVHILYLSPLTCPSGLWACFGSCSPKTGSVPRARLDLDRQLRNVCRPQRKRLLPSTGLPDALRRAAVAIEAWFATIHPASAHAQACLRRDDFLGGVVIWPFAMPMMSVEKFIAYEHALGVAPKKPKLPELNSIAPAVWPNVRLARDAKKSRASTTRFRRRTAPRAASPCAITAKPARSITSAANTACRGHHRHQNYWLWGPHN